MYFFIGKWKGRNFLEQNKYTQKSFEKAKELLNKYGVYSIFIIRFLYGMRMVPMMLMGASGIGIVKFTIFNLISLLVWAVVYLTVGYFFGHTAEVVFGKVKEYYFMFIIVVIVIITLIAMYPYIKRKFRKDS
jgi:membrane protein DedA with SNARE-associated domain